MIRLLSIGVMLGFMTSCANLPLAGKSSEKAMDSAAQKEARLTELRQSDRLQNEKLEAAGAALTEGRLDEAESLFNTVLQGAPQNTRALNGLQTVANRRKHPGIVESARLLLENGDAYMAERRARQVLMEDPHNTDALALIATIVAKRDEKKHVPPVLKVANNNPISLEFREANIKVVFELLSKNTGINFILDKDIRPDQRTSIYLKSAPLKDVLDAFLTANQLQKKIINESTVIIYQDNPMKAREYDELLLRSFYLAHADVKQVSSMLKSMLNVKDIYTDDKSNLLLVRDTEDVIRMTERLVRSMDVPDPEVMLEMEVLEVNSNTIAELGIQYPSQLSVISDKLTLQALKRLSANSIGVSPNPAINFSKSTGDINTLANPSIRVKNREKARIHIGDRIPITTSNVATTGTISENVQYLDVGLKLEVEPVINIEDDVSIKVGLEVSSVGTPTKSNNGTTLYPIGTRNATTMLKLKDGETQILAGLISDEDRNSVSKLPGLSDIPLIGRLFSDKKTEKRKTDVILSITPHIIRNLATPSAEASEVLIGPATKIGNTPIGMIQGVPATLAPFLVPGSSLQTGGNPATSPTAASGVQQPAAGNAGQNAITLPNGLSFPSGGQLNR